jgi:hypothetical protein
MSTMTQTEHPGRTAHSGPSDRPAQRARLISGRLALVLMSSFGALTSFYLLLSVTPMYAMSAGAGSALKHGVKNERSSPGPPGQASAPRSGPAHPSPDRCA